MNEVIKINDLTQLDFIDRVEDRTGCFMARMRIFFKNGRELSVIRGEFSLGGPQGLYEIMADKDCYDEEDGGSAVLGHLTKERVIYYINKIGVIP